MKVKIEINEHNYHAIRAIAHTEMGQAIADALDKQTLIEHERLNAQIARLQSQITTNKLVCEEVLRITGKSY